MTSVNTPDSPHADRPDTQEGGAEAPDSNIVMRLEDRFQSWRARRGLDSGSVPMAKGFIGYGTSTWVRVLGRVVVGSRRTDQVAAFEAASKVVRDGIRGWRNFVNPPLPFAKVTVTIADQEFEATADRGGVIDVTLPHSLPFGWNTVTITPQGGRPGKAEVRIVDEARRLGIVSDIDDTVMVTALPRPMLAAWNTFIVDEHARTPTPGMPVLYERMTSAKDVGILVYLSTGPWNVASTLKRFLARNLYPKAPLLLTDWGPTQTRYFRSGKDHKISQLRRLVAEFPGYRWILVGDDGQHDEEIYAWFEKTYPDRVEAVIIRQLSASEAVLAGGRSQRPRIPGSRRRAPWIYGPDGSGIARQLAELGYIDDGNSSTEVSAGNSDPAVGDETQRINS
ncbi:App1 family protein [Falsarthrobacter nasiphocae]|uniref:Phosphatidate phosphatase APP1 n=1 Tax=Falsarthrobacter nasiphocae TaxID=189863 RepID=A0AAE3YGF8_9MICC|nr:phosphatase domain-containing protein [Falsarthrobacter nasiphocae]MDR6891709.1 phosphatidate phosphatase APP1 [Falsarthrobacter nasiphocae]